MTDESMRMTMGGRARVAGGKGWKGGGKEVSCMAVRYVVVIQQSSSRNT